MLNAYPARGSSPSGSIEPCGDCFEDAGLCN